MACLLRSHRLTDEESAEGPDAWAEHNDPLPRIERDTEEMPTEDAY